MIKISTICGLGAFIILIRYSGLPMDWKNFLYVVSGLSIIILSLLIRKELFEVLRRIHTENVTAETIKTLFSGVFVLHERLFFFKRESCVIITRKWIPKESHILEKPIRAIGE